MYQKITLIGHLGSDPELHYTPTGRPVANFSVATNRKWTDNAGQPQEETAWFRVSAWGRLGETCNQYLHKGRQILVEGRLSPDRQTGGPRVWVTQDGRTGASYEVIAFEVRFLGGPEDSAGVPTGLEDGVPEDEIPF